MATRLIPYFVASVTLAAVWLFGIFLPLRREKDRIEVEAADVQQQIREFNTIMASLPQYLKTLDELQRARLELSSRLYAKEDILRLFDNLHQRAARHGLDLTEITPPVEELLRLNRAAPDSAFTQLLSLGLKLEGRFVDFGQFVDDLEAADFFRGITDCRIMGPKEGHGPIRMHLGFKVLLMAGEELT